jgi:acetyl-CoA acyltransferase
MAAHIVGAGMTPFGFAPDATLRSLAVAAVDAALADAGIGPSDVDMVVFANAGEGVLTGQEMVRGEVVFHRYGFGGAPMLNVENACASASTALHVATLAVAAGAAEIAVAVGAEKLTNPDKRRTMAVFSSAVDFDDMPDLRTQVERDLLGLGPAGDADDATDRPVQSALMAVYAATARRFFARGGASVEDAAAVAVKNRAHAAANPRAQFRQPTTVEQVLASRMIADPLRLHMCSPVADGAAAVVVCSDDRLGSLTRTGTDVEAVRIDASVLRSGGDAEGTRADIEDGAVSRAAAGAYEAAGVGPDDLDVVEVHDAAAPAELLTYEQLGLCAPGGAPELLAEGSVCLGGRRPVNPSGGLLSRGHPIGATGLGQVVELVDQLRGRCGPRQVAGARIALAQNSGGYMSGEEAVAVVTILSRGRT